MLNNISLGRYYPAHSFLHDMDPRVKTILYAVYLVAIFIIKEPVTIAVLAGIIILQLIMAKVTPGILWSTVKPMLPLALFIFIINAIIIELTASIVGPFQVDSFGYALLFSLIITALNYLLELPNRWLNRTTYKPRGDKDTDDDGFTEYEEVQ